MEQQLIHTKAPDTTIPQTLSKNYLQKLDIKAELCKVQKNLQKHQEDEQIEELYRHQFTGDYDQAKILCIIHNAKLSAEVFMLIKAAQKNCQPPRLTNLDIPTFWTIFDFDNNKLDNLENTK